MYQQCQSLVNLERAHGCSQFYSFPFFYRFKVFQNKEKYKTPGWRWGGREREVSNPFLSWPVLPCQVSTFPSIFCIFPMFLILINVKIYIYILQHAFKNKNEIPSIFHTIQMHSTLNFDSEEDGRGGRESTHCTFYYKPLNYLGKYHHHLHIISLTSRIKIHNSSVT